MVVNITFIFSNYRYDIYLLYCGNLSAIILYKIIINYLNTHARVFLDMCTVGSKNTVHNIVIIMKAIKEI